MDLRGVLEENMLFNGKVTKLEDNKRKIYGKYKGYYKWDLTKDWFAISNDEFFEIYGFNYNPHETKGLYEDCRLFLSSESEKLEKACNELM